METAIYESSAQTTEAPITAEVESKVSAMGDMILAALNAQRALGDLIDGIKKSVFYGALVDFDRLLGALAASFHELDAPSPKTQVPKLSTGAIRLLHSVLGLASETGEIALTVESLLIGAMPVDAAVANLVEEYGDLEWYVPLGIAGINGLRPQTHPTITLGKILAANVEKLRARYPHRFNKAAAISRDVRAEADAISHSLEGTP